MSNRHQLKVCFFTDNIMKNTTIKPIKEIKAKKSKKSNDNT